MTEQFDAFTKGQELATRAESGGALNAINDELAKLHKEHPKEFGKIVESMKGKNAADLADDQTRVQKEMADRSTLGKAWDKLVGNPDPSLKIPKLTIEGDSPKDKTKDPTHISIAILPELTINQPSEKPPAPVPSAAPKPEREYTNTAIDRERMANDFLMKPNK